jgi:hypothetical protein
VIEKYYIMKVDYSEMHKYPAKNSELSQFGEIGDHPHSESSSTQVTMSTTQSFGTASHQTRATIPIRIIGQI